MLCDRGLRFVVARENGEWELFYDEKSMQVVLQRVALYAHLVYGGCCLGYGAGVIITPAI